MRVIVARKPSAARRWAASLTPVGLLLAVSVVTHGAENVPGVEVYQSQCASCHGKGLDGGFGHALKGDLFKTKWEAKGLPALTTYIAQSMPPSNPGSLSPDESGAVAAYLASENGISFETKHAKAGEQGGGTASQEANHDRRYDEVIASRSKALAQLRPVSEEMLRRPPGEDWLNHRRTDDGHAFSPLSEINTATAPRLSLAWSLTLPTGSNEITPTVHDGVMFLNSAGTVQAIDTLTSEVLWKFVRPLNPRQIGPPITQARGLAIFGERLFVPTMDNHMLALDMHSGRLLWDHLVTGMQNWMRMTAAPLVVHGKVIEGASGCWSTGEGGRCFIVALDASTGEEVWRFNTIPYGKEAGGNSWNGAPDDKRSGGSAWSPGTYDEQTNQIYYGTGQTYHIASLMLPTAKRSAANAGLYTDSTLALNPDTGKLAWYYQHMARDVWDLDWSFERVLATIDVDAKPRRVVMTIGKIGIMDVLDAKTGKYLFSHDLGFQNLITRIDPVTGWKTTDPSKEPEPHQAKFVCPYASGVRSWPGTSYDDSQHLLFVGTSDVCMDMTWNLGADFDISFNARSRPDGNGDIGAVTAISLASRKTQWRQTGRAPEASAMLATAGGLLFEGGRDRMFRARSSASGEVLWSARLNNVPSASPVTFSAGGHEYVAIATGGGNPYDAIVAFATPEIEPVSPATTLWVFKLSDTGAPAQGN